MKSGRLKCFLGIEIVDSKQAIFISQQKYAIDILKVFSFLNKTSTPIDPHYKLQEAKEDGVYDRQMYQRFVGKLIYFIYRAWQRRCC